MMMMFLLMFPLQCFVSVTEKPSNRSLLSDIIFSLLYKAPVAKLLLGTGNRVSVQFQFRDTKIK